MRPINLIPEDQRRGPGTRKKGGALAYILIGALVVLLGGVALLVSTNNEISSSKAELAEAEVQTSAAEAKIAKLAAYTKIEEIHDQRVATVTELANSRFDWERVMRELALILPSNIWLTNLTGTVSPAATVSSGSSIALRSGVAGPALEMIGCGTSQDAVAGFVTALKGIDGVTRVALEFSKLPAGGEAGAEGSSAETGGGCQTRPFIPTFQIVAAFDAAPTTVTAPEGE